MGRREEFFFPASPCRPESASAGLFYRDGIREQNWDIIQSSVPKLPAFNVQRFEPC
jgi:hypothetical protein